MSSHAKGYYCPLIALKVKWNISQSQNYWILLCRKSLKVATNTLWLSQTMQIKWILYNTKKKMNFFMSLNVKLRTFVPSKFLQEPAWVVRHIYFTSTVVCLKTGQFCYPVHHRGQLKKAFPLVPRPICQLPCCFSVCPDTIFVVCQCQQLN